MALGGGMSCVKYLLFGFNLLFAVTGLVLLAVGARTLASAAPYAAVSASSLYSAAPALLILVALVVFGVAFLGCCGAVRENHCMIVTFSVCLLGIVCAELAVGVAGYVKRGELESSVQAQLQAQIAHYGDDPAVKKTFDIFQTDMSCCGIQGPGDWAAANLTIPDSCCAGRPLAPGAGAACAPGAGTLHARGCLAELVAFFRDKALLLAGAGVGVAVVQLLGVTLACCLARSIRSQYETV